jgi:hypothetical protein
MRLGVAVFAFATLIGASTASAECLTANQDGQLADGGLSLGTFEDANDRPEKAYILTLPAPTCLSGSDDTDKVSSADTIHIYSSDEAIAQSLKQLVGKKVKVKGSPFGAIYGASSRADRHGDHGDQRGLRVLISAARFSSRSRRRLES